MCRNASASHMPLSPSEFAPKISSTFQVGLHVVVQVVPRRQVERQPVHGVAAQGAEHVVDDPREHGRGHRRRAERQVVPLAAAIRVRQAAAGP